MVVTAAPAASGVSTVVWVLLAVGGVLVVGAAAVGVGAYYLYSKYHGELPLAISGDDDAMRVTFNMGNGRKITINEGTQKDGLEIDSPAGKLLDFYGGAAAKVPAWVPVYPGVSATDVLILDDGNGQGGSYQMTSTAAAPQVLTFFRQSLETAGFEVDADTEPPAAPNHWMNGYNQKTLRRLSVIMQVQNGVTKASVHFDEAKAP